MALIDELRGVDRQEGIPKKRVQRLYLPGIPRVGMFTGLVGLGALAIRLVSCSQLSLVDWIVRYWHGRFRVLWL